MKPVPSQPSNLQATAPRDGLALGLVGSLLLHAALLSVVVLQLFQAEVIGGGGTTLEAISVEVVSASALEAREAQPRVEASAASSHSIADTDGQTAEVASAAAAEVAPKEMPIEPPMAEPSKTEPGEPEVKAEQPTAVPPEPAPRQIAALPTPVPDAIMPEPTEQSKTEESAREEPKRLVPVVATKPDQPAREATPPPQPSSAAMPSGGVAARGSDGQNAASARAAASPGELRRYAIAVSKALEAAKLKYQLPGRRGRALVTFVLTADGELETVQVSKASGEVVVDEAAVQLLRRASFPEPPRGASRTELTYTVPIDFR